MIDILSIGGELYVSFLKDGKRVKSNTTLKDNKDNRLRLENEIIPELILTLNMMWLHLLRQRIKVIFC